MIIMLFQVYIKSNLQRNVTDDLFVMICEETDKASVSMLNVYQWNKNYAFLFTENRLRETI